VNVQTYLAIRYFVELEITVDSFTRGEVKAVVTCRPSGDILSIAGVDEDGAALELTEAEFDAVERAIPDAWQEHRESAREDYDDRMYG